MKGLDDENLSLSLSLSLSLTDPKIMCEEMCEEGDQMDDAVCV